MGNELKNYESINILDKLNSELEILLNNELYISALIVALTIPDFMGRIAYPNTKSFDRYVKWFDEYFVHYMGYTTNNFPLSDLGKPSLNGELCYALRCKLLHEGNDDLKDDLNIDEFVLVREKDGFVKGIISGTDYDYIQKNGQLIPSNIKYRYISIREIVNGLLKGASIYRKKHYIEKQLTRLKVNDGGGKISKIFSFDHCNVFKKK